MKKVMILLLTLVLLLSACAQSGTVPTQPSEEAYPMTLTDMAGRTVTLNAKPEKLVSGYYISTSALIALGLEDNLVGVEAKADKRAIYRLSAPQLVDLPSVGTAKEFDLEGCIALQPDLVILPLKLKEAAAHTDLNCVVLNEAESTVYITDPGLQLDVGAVAKGWSVQRVSETAPAGLLISVGGNVSATGPKDDAGTPWVVGVQNPDGGESFLHTLYLTKGSVVTSGDYQRAYRVDGKLYHHIIDPQTLYPSEYWRSVTVVSSDSGLADALSTALFLLPLEEGQKLLEPLGVQAMWVDREGKQFYSSGFEKLIRT